LFVYFWKFGYALFYFVPLWVDVFQTGYVLIIRFICVFDISLTLIFNANYLNFLQGFTSRIVQNFRVFFYFGTNSWTLRLNGNIRLTHNTLSLRINFQTFCSLRIVFYSRYKTLSWFRLPQFSFRYLSIPGNRYWRLLSIYLDLIFGFMFNYLVVLPKHLRKTSLARRRINVSRTWIQISFIFVNFFNRIS